MPKSSTPLQQQIRDAEFRIAELEQEYLTQLYLETMPEIDPLYKYCYATSNLTIPLPTLSHSVDAWLSAVIKHMSKRRAGHGGAATAAELVLVPVGLTEKQIDAWLAYVTDKLKKKALAHKKRASKPAQPK